MSTAIPSRSKAKVRLRVCPRVALVSGQIRSRRTGSESGDCSLARARVDGNGSPAAADTLMMSVPNDAPEDVLRHPAPGAAQQMFRIAELPTWAFAGKRRLDKYREPVPVHVFSGVDGTFDNFGHGLKDGLCVYALPLLWMVVGMIAQVPDCTRRCRQGCLHVATHGETRVGDSINVLRSAGRGNAERTAAEADGAGNADAVVQIREIEPQSSLAPSGMGRLVS